MKSLMKILLIFVTALTPARAQWTEPVRISEPGAMLYPQILAHEDTLHVVYTNLNGPVRLGYLKSENAGETWSESKVLSDTLNTSETLYPRIIRDGNNLIVLWQAYYLNWPFGFNIGYSISRDCGISWSPAEYAISQNWSFPFYLTATGTDSIINIVVYGYPDNEAIFYGIRSTNFGQYWTQPEVIFSSAQSGFTDEVPFDNLVYLSWAGRFGSEGPWETYYLISTDRGISWSESISLSEIDEFDSYNPSITVNELGYIGLTWMDFKYSPYWFTGDILIRQSSDQGAVWTSELQITENHRSTLSDLVWSGDTVCVAWQDERPENGGMSIYYSQSPDGGQSWSPEYRLDNSTEESRNPGLAISNGKICAIWADDRCDPDTEICGGIYFMRLETEVEVEEDSNIVLPEEVSLDSYPNPFNSSVSILLNIQKGGDAKIDIYDLNGRLVRTLFKGGILEEGTHKFTWDATDASGKTVGSGPYFAVADTPQGKNSKTLMLIR